PQGEQSSHLLGVISEGRFDSFFKDKSSPLVEKPAGAEAEEKADAPDPALQLDRVIERSPDAARIILFSSNDFMRDQV
ncbi:hypothetical protein, partial [Klebsiella pneumoniae]|uniref:hypothetical protein n=1 Tax=Klebsiella pneumoniae TaxID=573 RepID=UPI0013A58706